MTTAYILGCLALIMKPGPDMTCTLATAIAEGKARATAFMCGLILGCFLWIVLLSVGAASFFETHRAVTLSIQIAGAAYIAYLAFAAYREAYLGFRGEGEVALRPAGAVGWRLIGRGVCMAMSNPLTILFFLAFLPGFTESGNLPPALGTLLLGALFCSLVPFVYMPIIFAADFFRAKFAESPKALATLKLASALMLTAVSALLALRLR